MPTTRQIATAAGVSQSTVVRALANDPIVSQETRKRIVAVAQSMGYRPNPLVSTLMAFKRSVKSPSERFVMGYLTTDKNRDAWRRVKTYVDFYEGAAARAKTYGFELEEFWLAEPKMTGRRMSEILYSRNISAVLIAPLRSDRMWKTQTGKGHVSLDWRHFSAATIGYTLVRPAMHRATHNHLLGVRQAVRQLRKLGYRRIGLALDAVHDARVDYNWSIGFTSYLASLPQDERTEPLILGFPAFNQTTLERWYKEQRPDVILSGSWLIHEWLTESGIEVPKEVGFALLDRAAPDASPTVAGIDQNGQAVAAASVDLIVGQLHRNERGLPELPKTTMIEGYWSNGTTVRARR
jgi:LacI family transcriptional regulator